MTGLQKMILAVAVTTGFAACKNDSDPTIVVSNFASTGVERVQFNGIAGTEAGSSAYNSVYLDFSNDKTTTALRSGWDLGFYSGSDFRVVLNNTSSAGAKVTTKFDLSTVNVADTVGYGAANITLAVSQTDPQPSHLAYFDNLAGDINQTVIPAVSATDASNPVIILNRGTGGSIAARAWMKLRITRNGANGYTVQYAPLAATSNFITLNVTKDAAYNFQYISFENGVVSVEPKKTEWDLRWTYSVFGTDFGGGTVPYNFSDLIDVNYLANVQVKQRVYADAATATAAYNAFNRDSINANPVTTGRWTIGSSWRSTQPATGANLKTFYLIKDANGNYYKFKCLAMGVGTDGGTRGKPEFKYTLIP
jgi:hypothetical protein